MTTKSTVESHFAALGTKQDWPAHLSDEIVFTSFTSPNKTVSGKAGYLESTKRFYGMIQGFELRGLIAEGDRACALTRYKLQPPVGPSFQSDVAEVFRVRNGKIQSLDIYFDSSPFPK